MKGGLLVAVRIGVGEGEGGLSVVAGNVMGRQAVEPDAHGLWQYLREKKVQDKRWKTKTESERASTGSVSGRLEAFGV